MEYPHPKTSKIIHKSWIHYSVPLVLQTCPILHRSFAKPKKAQKNNISDMLTVPSHANLLPPAQNMLLYNIYLIFF